jgi:hypothetical protein
MFIAGNKLELIYAISPKTGIYTPVELERRVRYSV